MSKTALATPMYLSVAWIVMVTYQIFTQSAVSAVLNSFATLWPALGEWLLLKIDMIIFIHAFAWVFVLSSVIPSILLGKKRGVLVQFGVCLTLALVAFIIQDYVTAYLNSQSQILQSIALLLSNPLLALAYVSLPYIFMVALDIRARRRSKKAEHMDNLTTTYLESFGPQEQEANQQ
jgi:hypothetical protein